jgi:hypothetical protein
MAPVGGGALLTEAARADGLVIQHLYQPESEFLNRLRDAKVASGYLAGIPRDGAEIILLGAIP